MTDTTPKPITETICQKLSAVQAKLKVPKNQYNEFGGYAYRSCEDILEAAKPILRKHRLVLFLTDEIRQVGDRYYVEATARLTDLDSDELIECRASAREAETKKGMDASQVTGSASSYARKYALNGLFNIDDTKDADATNTHGKEAAPPKPTPRQSQPKTGKYVCADCGKPFQDITSAKTGKTWTAAQLYHISESKNEDGKARCRGCQKKHDESTRKE